MQMKNIFIAIALILLFCSLHAGAQSAAYDETPNSAYDLRSPKLNHILNVNNGDNENEVKDIRPQAPVKIDYLPILPLTKKRPLPELKTVPVQTSLAPKTPSECKSTVPRHIGFDAIGENIELGIHPDKSKRLQAVTIDFSTADDLLSEGIPLPCVQMMEVTVDKNDKNKKQSDIFDLKIRECSINPRTDLGRIVKAVGNVFKKDPNAKENLKKFSFNPKDDHTFLKDEHLKTLYPNGTSLNENSDGIDELNKVLGKANCKLRATKEKGSGIEDYIVCDKVSNRLEIKNHLSKTLKDECAVGYASNAIDNLSFYSSSPLKTKEENVIALKECVKKHRNLSEELKPKEHIYELKPMPKSVAEGDDFLTYDYDCKIKASKEVTKNIVVSSSIRDISKQYSDDFFVCHDCQGVKVLSDNQIEFTKEVGEISNSACNSLDLLADSLGEKEGCEGAKLTCNSIKDLKCAQNLIELSGESSPLVNFDSYDTLVSTARDEIDKKYVLPLHQAAFLMTKEKNQNRYLNEDAAIEFKNKLDHLRLCVKQMDKSKLYKIASPQPEGTYLSTKLEYLSKLVKKFDSIKPETTPEEIKKIVVNGDKKIPEAFKQYASDSKTLSKLSKEEMSAKAKEDKCSALSNIASHELACELSPDILSSTRTEITNYVSSLEVAVSENLEALKEEERAKDTYPSSDLAVMSDYLKIIEGGFNAKSTQDMIKFMALSDDIGTKTNDLGLECDGYSSSFTGGDIAVALGLKGKRLPIASGTKGEVASDEEDLAAKDQEIEALQGQVAALQQQNAQLQQQLSMALAQMGGGGMAGSGMYANAMLQGFSQFTNALAGISANNTNALLGSFGTYAQSFNQMATDFSTQMYNMHNSSLNGMLYSQQMYMQSMQMSRSQMNSPYGAISGWI